MPTVEESTDLSLKIKDSLALATETYSGLKTVLETRGHFDVGEIRMLNDLIETIGLLRKLSIANGYINGVKQVELAKIHQLSPGRISQIIDEVRTM